jgi:hypothetical protein
MEETYMRTTIRSLFSQTLIVLLAAGISLALEEDVDVSHDHPLLNRMPGFYIESYTDHEFDTHEFMDADLNAVSVNGHLYKIVYALQTGAREPSQTEILRNYENAIE